MEDNNVRNEAQKQAEEAYANFMLWSGRVTIVAIFSLLLVLFGCNNGVDGSGSAYNGDQYSPNNLKVEK